MGEMFFFFLRNCNTATECNIGGWKHLIVQASSLGHGRQRHPISANVAEDLINHEAEEEEVQTGTDPCHNYKRHLRRNESRKRLKEH